jgi:hypothetical protein
MASSPTPMRKSRDALLDQRVVKDTPEYPFEANSRTKGLYRDMQVLVLVSADLSTLKLSIWAQEISIEEISFGHDI